MDRLPSDAAPDPGSPFDDALTALLDCDSDLDAFERVLVAAAVHPSAGGASRAWLLRWDARRETFELVGSAAPSDVPGRLAHALGRARRTPPQGARPGLPRLALRDLGEPAKLAWRNGAPETGVWPAPGWPWADAASVVCAPLRRGTRGYGLLIADHGALEPLRRLAELSHAGMGAQLRAAEARRRARQVTGLAEFAHASVSAINVAEGLHLLARLAAQGTGARGAAVYRAGAEGVLEVAVTHGPAALRDVFARGFDATARACASGGRLRVGYGAAEAESLPPNVSGEVSVWAAVPIIAYSRALGVLVTWDAHDRPASSPEWERGDVEYLAALADQAGLLLEHARSLEGLERSEARRGELAARLREQDRLATLGEMAGRVADEARNPLASIAAFARRAQRESAEDDPRRELLEVVLRETERLDAMLREQLDYARLQRPRLEMRSLNAIVQEALHRSSEALVRRRVRLVKKLLPDLPELLLDAGRIQRVIENVLTFALESVAVGGRLKIETRRAQDFAILEIAHDGARQAGDLIEQLFVSLTQGGAGASVGLGMAHQIVREHGGEIRVRSEGEWGAVFALTLPVQENRDRRGGADRRAGRRDRRRRKPDA